LVIRPSSVGRFKGAVNGGPVRATVAVAARLVPVHSNIIGDVITVPSVALQWRGWPHRVDSDGKDRSRRPDVTAWPCVVTEKVFEGTVGPLRGLGALAVRG
jgi:hypothetical protein